LVKVLLGIEHHRYIVSYLLMLIHNLLSLDASLVVMSDRTIGSEYLWRREFLLLHELAWCTFVKEGALAA
jgi:hypothetical protein